MISVVKSVLVAYPPMSGVRTYKSIQMLQRISVQCDPFTIS